MTDRELLEEIKRMIEENQKYQPYPYPCPCPYPQPTWYPTYPIWIRTPDGTAQICD